MSFLDKMGKTFSDTVKSVTEKNHKMAKMNRFRNRIALAQEEKEKAYIAIGKYYYEREKELPDEGSSFHLSSTHRRRNVGRIARLYRNTLIIHRCIQGKPCYNGSIYRQIFQ